MSKVVFFYFNGTDPLIATLLSALGQAIGTGQPLGLLNVPGITTNATWLNGNARNDPFASMLDPNIFRAYHVQYPALAIPIAVSINVGITKLVAAINSLPQGQKFMMGGYSQGAVIAGTVYRMINGGSLSSRANDFLGGCCFGSPIRQQDFRGEVGGTWSGSWDVPGSISGGRGQFSPTGTFPRLTGCDPTKWIEFADENDIFTCTGATQKSLNWTTASNIFNDVSNVFSVIPQLGSILQDVGDVITLGNAPNTYTDASGRVFQFSGSGHTAYPWRPPPGNPDNGLTSYQIAIKWLTSKANASTVGTNLLPPTPATSGAATGWSTSLTA